jgi:AcrR family transcriptional regulator
MGLDKNRVTREALDLLNEVGLIGLTLRRLADRLGVKAPALYWHVRNKQELLDEMATAMMREALADAPSTDGVAWTTYMTQLATRLRAALLRYRDGAKVVSGTYATDDALLRAMEKPLRVLTEAGFSLREAVSGYSTVYAYTIGFVIEEQAAWPHPDALDERYVPEVRAARLDPGRFPLAAAAGRELFGVTPDLRFEDGLSLIVAGMGQTLDARS